MLTAVIPAALHAQSERPDDTTKLADQLIDCGGMTDKTERLECYDALVQPLMGIEADDRTAEEGAEALHRFTGKDDWDSEVLELTKPWRLVWQHEGSLLTVELRTDQDEMVDVIGNQIGAGGGRSERLEPGTYRLAVRALGGWRIRVISDE